MLPKLKILASKILPWHKHAFFLFVLLWGSFYTYQFMPDWAKIPLIISAIALSIYPLTILAITIIIKLFGTKEGEAK